jgi:ankyrin repeat protein
MAEVAALVELAKTGDIAMIREMLATDPALAGKRMANGETPLMAALYRGHHDVVAVLIDAGATLDVFAAAATGRLPELRRALSAEAINSYAYDGWTPLHLAAFFGQLDAVKLLLDAGADTHAVSRNGLKNTPLHAATAGKHTDVALALLAHGADPAAVDAGGYTPLKIAEANELAAVVTAISSGPH